MITHRQLYLIHKAARAVNLIDADKNEQRYRMLLKNTAGVDSAKDLNQAQFEDVMAVLEDEGFRGGGSPTYWRDKVAARGSQANARQLKLINDLHAANPRYALAALCKRFSSDRVDRPERLYPREAWKLIEMLKASNAREAAPTLTRRRAEQPVLFPGADDKPTTTATAVMQDEPDVPAPHSFHPDDFGDDGEPF